MKIKVKKVYDKKNAQAVFDSLKCRHVTYGHTEAECYDMTKIGWVSQISEYSGGYSILGYGAVNFIAELEIESDEPKVYHAANCEEARHLEGKKIQEFNFETRGWDTKKLGRVDIIRETNYPFAFEVLDKKNVRLWAAIIREYKPTTKTISIEEAQKLLSEKLGEDVRIEG